MVKKKRKRTLLVPDKESVKKAFLKKSQTKENDVEVKKKEYSLGRVRNSKGNIVFGKGNPGGPGNAIARQAARFRIRLFKAIDEDEFHALVRKLYKRAMNGEPWANKLLWDNLLGPPVAWDFAQQISNVEEMIKRLEERE